MTSFPLHLMRHGALREQGLFMGHTDSPSTIEGIAACVDQVADLQIETLISSDLIRAARAGDAIARARALTVETDPRWRELDFGTWDGRAGSEIDDGELARFWDDPDDHHPPGGERWSGLIDRVRDAIGELAPRPTLIVTHGGAMRAALAVLCGFSLPQLWAFDFPYASLISLRVWPGERPSAQIIGLWP